jgi:AcrR family transcriptional regulator
LHKKPITCKREYCLAMVESLPKVATRDAILDASDRMVSHYGFRKTTMEDIAREAGVSKRTIYVYFASKEEVGMSLLRRVVDRIQVRLDAICDSDLPTADKLREVLIVRTLERVIGVKDSSACLDELYSNVRTRSLEQRREFFETDVRLVAKLLEEGRKDGLRFDEGPSTARALLLATSAFIPYSLSVDDMGGIEVIERDLRATVKLLVKGLRQLS